VKFILVLFFPLVLFSCSSSHEIHINSDDSAVVKFSVTNKPSLVETLIEWGAVQNGETSEIIDVEQVKSDLEGDVNLSEVKLISDKKNNYVGSFFVKNIDNLFNTATQDIPPNLQVFSLTNYDGTKTLTIKLTLENYIYLKEALPMLQDETIDMLGPDANQDVTEEEYLDMMSFSLGDDGPQDIITSFINLDLTVDGSIINVHGGKIEDSNKAAFKVPLIDLILLKKTLIYSITYK
jgi:hypothetical protein